MTTDDTIDLLAWVQGWDRRTVGRIDVAVWHAAATRARWTLSEARNAVTDYYTFRDQRRDRWIEPADVTAGIKRLRDDEHRLAQQQERQRARELRAAGVTRPRPVEALTRRLGLMPGAPPRAPGS